MDWPPDPAREQARGDIPRATQYDACVVHAPRGRFGFRDVLPSLIGQDKACTPKKKRQQMPFLGEGRTKCVR
jgi:hypothetical protein